jgi:hypothetical protein
MDELIKEYLEYNSEEGCIRWKVKYGKMPANSIAGYRAADGYIRIGFKGKKYLAHRLSWFLHYNCWPSDLIDHIDGNKSNNCIDNLRIATKSLNGYNRAEQHGVGKYRNNTWRAYMSHAGKQYHIGYFKSESEAIQAHKKFKEQFMSINNIR